MRGLPASAAGAGHHRRPPFARDRDPRDAPGMRDLHLWRLLQASDPDPHELTGLLHELATKELKERLPYLGQLESAQEHPDACLRAATCAALAGVTGRRALKALVLALDDDDDGVRAAALSALLVSAQTDPQRWIHALLHPRVEIRREALKMAPRGLDGHWRLAMAADPECQDLALDAFRNQPCASPLSLRLIVEQQQQGSLTRAEAADLVLAIDWRLEAGRLAELWQNYRTPDRPVLREGCAQRWISGQDHWTDAIDSIFKLFLTDSGTTWDGERADRFFGGLLRSLRWSRDRGEDPSLAFRLATRALALIWRPTAHHPAPLALIAVVDPVLLAVDDIPLGLRQEALRRLGATLVSGPHEKPMLAHSKKELFLGPGSTLDLEVLLGLAALLESGAYAWIRRAAPSMALAEACWRAPELGARLFELRVAGDEDRSAANVLLHELVFRSPAPPPELLARFLIGVPSARLGPLVNPEQLSFDDAMQLVEGLLAVQGVREKSATGGRICRLLRALAAHAATGGWGSNRARAGIRVAAEAARDRGCAPGSWARVYLGELGRRLSARRFAAAAAALPGELLLPLLDLLDGSSWVPVDRERALARALANHDHARVRAWAEPLLGRRAREIPKKKGRGLSWLKKLGGKSLDSCSPDRLAREVELLFPAESEGLCSALKARGAVSEPNADVCASLLLCGDPPEEIAATFVDYAQEDASFLRRVEEVLVDRALSGSTGSLFAHAWLHRWEQHSKRFEVLVEERFKTFDALLEWVAQLPSSRLAFECWQAMARVCAINASRAPREFPRRMTEASLAEVSRPLLHDDPGVICPGRQDLRDAEAARTHIAALRLPAARILRFAHRCRHRPAGLDALRAPIEDRLDRLEAQVHPLLRDWLDVRGAESRPTRAAPSTVPTAPEELSRIAGLSETAILVALCRRSQMDVALAAAERLCELGLPGAQALLDTICAEPPPICSAILVDTLIEFGPEAMRVRALEAAGAEDLPPETRFALATALCRVGVERAWPAAAASACAPTERNWFDSSCWNSALTVASSELRAATDLAGSPHGAAHTRAIRILLAEPRFDEEVARGLGAYLEAGDRRPLKMRAAAATRLAQHDDWRGAPVLITWSIFEGGLSLPDGLFPRWVLKLAPIEALDAATQGALACGLSGLAASAAAALIAGYERSEEARQAALSRFVAETADLKAQQKALAAMRWRAGRADKVRRVSEAFAWGIREGQRLTGRLYTIQMIGGDDLAWTRLSGRTLHVNPLAIFRGDRGAGEIVRGLALHELGHHIYNATPEGEAVAAQATKERNFKLLNLVEDEHLERNLRRVDADYGEKLRTLAAYAFQHMDREIHADALVAQLGARTWPALETAALGVARRPGCVRVRLGALWTRIEASGHSFGRFMRALRMGLGNRHGDPKVAKGLALFGRDFRDADMGRLLEIARELQRIFGEETDLLDALDLHSVMEGDVLDEGAHGEGIEQAEIDREVDGVLGRSGARARVTSDAERDQQTNRGERTDFDPITHVEAVAPDPVAHASIASEVRRHSRVLRQFLMRLGLAREKQRMRVSGRQVDQSRLLAAAIRRDPRVLTARTTRWRSDLFLGVAIDCSGSMSSGDSMPLAQRFGVMLAEAARGIRGIDARFIGFTDSVIFDAGDAERCAVSSLQPQGGNNDAAALWHLAQQAQRSRRSARAVVMISDGAPTECTVEALRATAHRIHRRMGIVCAQVAVQPLDDVCFPHHVKIDDGDLSRATRQFGALMARLCRRAMAR